MRNVCLVALALMLPAVVHAQQPAPGTPAAQASAAQASTAPAGEQKAFVSVHLGGQATSSDLSDTFTFIVHDETATVVNNQEYGSGFLFNIEGGYWFRPRFAAGLAISRASGDIDARIDASIPHPQVFDAPRSAVFDVPDANHSETGYHFFAAYRFPVNENVDVRVFGGPSVFTVSHDLVSGIEFSEAAPFNTVTITRAIIDERSETVGAFHIGAGGTYRVTDRLGVDGFFRFARRTVDVSGVAGSEAEIKVGGAQLGVGVRVGF